MSVSGHDGLDDIANRRHDRIVDLEKEAATMALYVSISTFAALIAIRENDDTEQVLVLSLVWGTTLGLALAHWFAFRVAARLVGGGRLGIDDARTSVAQLGGAAAVAVVVSVPVAMFPASAELDAARFVLAAVMSIAGYRVARVAGGSRSRSLIGGGATLAVAVTVAVVKNVLSGH